MNNSEDHIQDLHEGPYENILYTTYYILVFIIALPGNALALWAFFQRGASSSSRVFLRHLSIADICYVLILPLRVVYHLLNCHWPFGNVLCQLSGFLFYLNIYSSMYLMSFISLDRLIAVLFALKSHLIRKAVYANAVVCALWVVIIVSTSPMLFAGGQVSSNSTGTCGKLYLERPSQNALVSTVVAFVIPLTTIVVAYILILVKLQSVRQHEERGVKDKAVKLIVLVVINFLFVFVPYHVSRVMYIQSTVGDDATADHSSSIARVNRVTSALMCLSGVLDPVMYFFLNKVYRRKLLELVYK
ncbi:uracil nucleotide/cysteinyl leukotriene receptor [Neosynchiropus ocellatus]